MKWCYNKLVIFILTLLFNNAKLNSLPQIYRVSSSSSLEQRSYAFHPTVGIGNNVALVSKLDGETEKPLSVGWSRIVTTVENQRGKILEHIIDYELSLQSELDLFNTEDSSSIDIYKARNLIVKEKDFTFCDPGPCYCNKIFTITINPKRNRFEIKPSLEALLQIMIKFAPIKPEVQDIISMILNTKLPEDQLSLSIKIIALVNKHLAFDLENLEISESAEVYDESDMIKYVDSTGVYCFRKLGTNLLPVQCPMDTSLIPLYNLDSDYAVPVKYIDSTGRVHCFDMNNYDLTPRECASDVSLLPQIGVKKYLDDNNSEYCSVINEVRAIHFVCPKTLSSIPLTTLESFQNAIVKFVDPQGRLHCYLKNNMEFSETACPENTLNLPTFNPYKNFVKYVDAQGKTHCFYKSDSLKPIACPADLSLVRHISLNNEAIPMKYIGPDGITHCFTYSASLLNKIHCPEDTSLFPTINIKKFIDENGVEICYLSAEHADKQIECPEGLNLWKTSLDDLHDIIVKDTDSQGRVRCYRKTGNNFNSVICPRDTSLLPEINPIKYNIPGLDLVPEYIPAFGRDHNGRLPALPSDIPFGSPGRGYYPDQDLVKYVDATGEYCYRKGGTTLLPVQCPMDTSLIPLHNLDSHYAMPVKHTDSYGRVHCFDMTTYDLRPRMCPLDTSLLPEINVKKYLDNNNIEYCSVFTEVSTIQFTCPQSLSSLPLTPLDAIDDIIVKSTDMQGRVHCYRKTANNFHSVICPRDTSLLPEVSPFKYNLPGLNLVPEFRPPFGRDHSRLPFDSILGPAGREFYPGQDLVKYMDATGEYCYRKGGTTLHPVQCPMDTSLIPKHNLDSDHALPVKYVDSNGRVHCFDMNSYNLRPRICPLDTSLLPTIDVKKYLDDNNREYCSAFTGLRTIQFACPHSLSSLPVTPSRNTLSSLDLLPEFRPPFAGGYSRLPFDSHLGPGRGRGYYPDQNLVKYVDATGEYCYRKGGTTLQPVQCPVDTSSIPLHNLDSDHALPVKYIDSNGRVHCFDMNRYDLRPRICPLDTSLLPEIDVKKYLDDNNKEYCTMLNEVRAVHFICPKSLSSLPLTPLDALNGIIVKSTDMQGRVRCYRKTANNFNPVICPRDTSMLPEVNPLRYNTPGHDLVPEFRPPFGGDYSRLPFDSHVGPGRGRGYYPDQNLVKYVDATGEYCYRKGGTTLQPVQCPVDTSSIPLHNLDSDHALPVKYIDSNGRVHCFDMNRYDLRPRICPLDTSLLPEIDVKKYLDDNNKEYCTMLNEVRAVHFICPKSLSSLPLTPLDALNGIIVKSTDMQGRVRCYRKTANNFNPVICPRDTSMLPEVNPLRYNTPGHDLVPEFRPPFGGDYSRLPFDSHVGPGRGRGYYPDQDLVKYVDATGEYCYRKGGTTLHPVQCPMDTSSIPLHNLDSDHALPVKYVDSNGRVHCFDMNSYDLKPRICPADTSLLPEIDVKKYLDDNNREHCSAFTGLRTIQFACPHSLSSLPVTPSRNTLSSLDLLPEFRPPFGGDYSRLPFDSHLGPGRGYYPDQDLVKYVDATGEYCYRKGGTTLHPVQCPMDTSSIPLHNLDSDHALPVKYIDSNGRVHCFDMNSYDLKPRICPADTSLLPEIDVKKYLDDYNREYCSAFTGLKTIQFACPHSLSSLPVTPSRNTLSSLDLLPEFRPPFGGDYPRLPFDSHLGPGRGRGYYPDQDLVKYVDATGEYCYRKDGTTLHPVQCPMDTSSIPLHNLDSDHALPVKYIDSNGRVHCFDMNSYDLKPRICPADTSLLPEINVKKYLDDNNKEYCTMLNEVRAVHFICPKSLSSLPLTPLDALNGIIVKSTDMQGRVRCYRKTANNFNPVICPRDTSMLPEVNPLRHNTPGHDLVPEFRPPFGGDYSRLPFDSHLGPGRGRGYYPDQDLVKYMDATGEYCYRKGGTTLHPVQCPMDTSSIPLHNLDSDHALPVKYIDSNGRVHCFDMNSYDLKPRICPADTSLLPEIDVKKYLDDNNREHCSAFTGHRTIQFACPHSLSSLPVTPSRNTLSSLDLLPEFRPPFGGDYPRLPFDSHLGPGRGRGYPDQDLVKYVDATGEYCYRKGGTTLHPVQCPMDTSSIPLHNLDSDHALPVKYIDSNGRVHCFDMNSHDLKPRICPADTSLLPEIDVKKYLDDNNREHCSAFTGHRTIQFACPHSLSSLPVTPSRNTLSSLDLLPEFRPPFGGDYPRLPFDSHLGPGRGRGYYPDQDLVKYVDATGEYCYRKGGTTLHPVQCPMDTSSIPLHNLDSDHALPVKYIDSNGRVHCFDMNSHDLKPRICPADTSLLPEIDVKKYLDDNNREHCSAFTGHRTIQFACPHSLSSLPVTPSRNTLSSLDLLPEFRPPFGGDYPRLPFDSHLGPGRGRGYYPDQDLVKYVDATGEYCYRKGGTTLHPVQCPMDTSSIPLHNLDSDHALPVKYIDSNGRVHCFDMNSHDLKPRICPADTSLLPEIDVKKYLDDNNREHCSAFTGHRTIQFACPHSLSSLPVTPSRNTLSSLDLLPEFRPPFGGDYPRLPFDSHLGPGRGRGYYPDQDLVKYVDATGEYCYRKGGTTLHPVQCPMDTSSIPLHNLDSDHALPVKYIDSNGRVHCFDMNSHDLKPRICPADTSLLPEIDVKKYLDDNNREHCSAFTGHRTIQFACPHSLSSLPVTPSRNTLSSLDLLPEFRPPFGGDYPRLPFDSHLGPGRGRGYYPDQDLVKYVDATGEYCYRKGGTTLHPVQCPMDTSSIPLHNLDSDHALPVKYIDSNGRVHCFDMNSHDLKPRICPADTSLLPEIDVKKYLDDNNREHCSAFTGHRTIQFACPHSLSSLPVTPSRNTLSSLDLLPEFRPPFGGDYPRLPFDSHLGPGRGRGYYPDQDLVKYVDATGEYCYRKGGTTLHPVQCPMDTSSIPLHNLDSDHALPVKYIDSNGRVHCFDMNSYDLKPRICPADTSLLPEIDVKKYLDDNNKEYCTMLNEVRAVHFICPKSLSSLPLTPLDALNGIIVKSTDMQGRVRCYRKTANNFNPVICPRDTSMLPEVNPLRHNTPGHDLVPEFRPPFGGDYSRLPFDSHLGPGRGRGYYPDQDLVKYMDATGEYCYRKGGTSLHPVQCPMDTSSIPLHNLDSDHALPVKYIDSNGRVHCFDMKSYDLKPRICPTDTSLLPEIDVKKYLDDNNREYCSAFTGLRTIQFACSHSLSSLPVTPSRNTLSSLDLLPEFRPSFGGDYPRLPFDSHHGPGRGRGYYPDQDLVKYVDATGEYCYRKGGTTLHPVQCPMDTSSIPLHNLDSDHALPVKYVDSNGRVHCFDMNSYDLRPRICPADTSLLPEIDVKKYLDDNNKEHCSAFTGLRTIQFACPHSLSSLPFTSLDALDGIIVKNTDMQGRVRCYRKTANNFNSVICPRDTSMLPEVNPFKNLRPPSFGRDRGYRDPQGFGSGRSPLMDILSGLNIERGSGDITLSYNNLMALINSMCKKI